MSSKREDQHLKAHRPFFELALYQIQADALHQERHQFVHYRLRPADKQKCEKIDRKII